MTRDRTHRRGLFASTFLGLIVAGCLIGATPALAETALNQHCMQELYNTWNGSQNLNCTANDIQLSAVRNIEILDDGCAFPGDFVSFRAVFETVLTAQARHDIGIYFGTDGDPNLDGALTGTCSVSTLDYQPDPPWLDLDMTGDVFVGTNDESGIQDTCGDIDNSHNPLEPVIELLGVLCIDSDGDGKLNLPYCTSWRQPGANELCTGPLPETGLVNPDTGATGRSSGVIPGSPSKCNCDPTFNVPIDVPPATITVTKVAAPIQLDEPGGSVTFAVTISAGGIDPGNGVTINSLVDSIYGDLHGQGTCSVPQRLLSGQAYSCSFSADVTGNAGDSETDVVTASGVDDRGNVLSDDDDATVTIVGVAPIIEVTKTADPTEVLEPGDWVTFDVDVQNQSVSSDPVTIDTLSDDIYGNITAVQGNIRATTCSVSQTIQPGATYSCYFEAYVAGQPGDSQTDEVTASGTDDDGTPVSDTDTAKVDVRDVPSMIEVTKTPSPTAVYEPGDLVAFGVVVLNKSLVDTVTITSLSDVPYGNITSVGGDITATSCIVPQTLAPSASYNCSFTAYVSGNAGEAKDDTVTASGTDDDGVPVSDDDTATVNILNVDPTATLSKTVKSAVVTYEVRVCNTSTAEAVTLTSLTDDIYGEITSVHDDVTATSCTVPQALAISGEERCYTCTFDAVAEDSTTDTVTGEVVDDDADSTPATPSDSATVTFGTVTP